LILIIKCILINQNFGRKPENSIPVLKNAITVQGIVYGHPHSHSFNPNLIYSGGAACPLSMNKSDYAFIDKTRIIIHSVLNESETVSRKLLVYKEDMTAENRKGGYKVQNEVGFPETKNSNMSYKSLGYSQDDNNYSNENMEESVAEGPLSIRNNLKRIESDDGKEYATFYDGEFTFKSLLKLVEEARSKMTRISENQDGKAIGGVWIDVKKILRLLGGGESSLNAASGWGSPPNANNNNG